MCKSTKGNQAASNAGLIAIQPNAPGAGGGTTPTPPANQFDGFQEHVPERVFVSTAGTAGFLTSANGFYTHFGLQPVNVNSIEHLLELLNAASPTVYQRILLVSHAHPRGMIIPFFTGGVNGTNKEVFREFAKSDLDGLKVLNPFDPPVFNWDSVFTGIMTNLRSFISSHSQFTNALTPFSLQSSGLPTGDLKKFFEQCFDFVFIGTAGRIKNSSGGNITPTQRNICKRFIAAIITQLGLKVQNTTVSGTLITAAHLSTLRDAITGMNVADLNVGTHTYSLSSFAPDNMNYYPTLDNAARAVNANFRANLLQARQRLSASSKIDIRGCRAGEDSDYLLSIREFFHQPVSPGLTVSAPRWFQSYTPLGWERPRNRADITSYLTRNIFASAVPPSEQRTAVSDWAEKIKVNPLHTQFFDTLLGGPAVAFCDVSWIGRIPSLFIPTPGIAALAGTAFPALVTTLGNFFNVPAASMPSSSQLTGLTSLLSSISTYNQSLLATVNATTPAGTLNTLFNGLKQVNTSLGQSLVPATAPSPLTAVLIGQYQTALINFLETNQLAPIKAFMTAAKNSLQSGDGLYYYILFAGLPIFFFNRFTLNHNGLMVFQPHQSPALQSWYKCIWAEALPSGSASATAAINQAAARRVPTLQDDHTLTELAMCPSGRYGDHLEFSPSSSP